MVQSSFLANLGDWGDIEKMLILQKSMPWVAEAERLSSVREREGGGVQPATQPLVSNYWRTRCGALQEQSRV